MIYGIIKEAVITEKAKRLELDGWYSFEISPRANKTQVADSLEKLYGVKVSAVRIVKVRQKVKTGAKRGEVRRRAAATKAYVKMDKAIAQLAKLK